MEKEICDVIHVLKDIDFSKEKEANSALLQCAAKLTSLTSNETNILRQFSEVESIDVQCGDDHLSLEGSPVFIKYIALSMKYTVRFKDGNAVRLIGNKTYSWVDNRWQLLN